MPRTRLIIIDEFCDDPAELARGREALARAVERMARERLGAERWAQVQAARAREEREP